MAPAQRINVNALIKSNLGSVARSVQPHDGFPPGKAAERIVFRFSVMQSGLYGWDTIDADLFAGHTPVGLPVWMAVCLGYV